MTLKEEILPFYWDAIQPEDEVNKYLNLDIVKKFSMFSYSDNLPWLSWQEFGTHKNVGFWYLLTNNIAVGLNENPSKGYWFVCAKLSEGMYKKALAHTLTYEQYHAAK